MRFLLLLLTTAILGCSAGPQAPDGATTTFTFRTSTGETFVARTSNRVVIARARGELALPESQRSLHVNGPIAPATSGANLQWSWQMVPGQWNMVEASIELCDGRPSMVEADLAYWLNVVGRFCPWSSRVVSEGP